MLPIYNAFIDDETPGIYCISLVKNPATEIDMQLFENEEKPLKFSVANDDKRLIVAPLMLADTPIYRVSGTYEYFVNFPKEVLREIAQKYFENGFENIFSTDHQTPIQGLHIQEIYIKDTERGINPKGFENVKDGSLFMTAKVEDEDMWNTIKNGEWKGISIEIQNKMKEATDDYDDILETINEIKNKLNKK